jgi:Flp pilus assembly protein TadD
VARPYVNCSADAAREVESLGYDALEDHRDADALYWLKQAVLMEPTIPRAWNNLGIAYGRADLDQQAADAFATADRLKSQTDSAP